MSSMAGRCRRFDTDRMSPIPSTGRRRESHRNDDFPVPSLIWPQRHVPNSIATIRRLMAVAIAPTLQRCQCCARADLFQRNLPLGLEPDRARNMRLGAAGPIVDPRPRQIEPIGDRQAGLMVGDRQRHRRLAIGLLAKLPAVLMMHPHRIPGPHARSPSSVHQRKPQSDPQSPFRSRDPSQPPADSSLDNHLILNQDQMRPTDSAN